MGQKLHLGKVQGLDMHSFGSKGVRVMGRTPRELRPKSGSAIGTAGKGCIGVFLVAPFRYSSAHDDADCQSL